VGRRLKHDIPGPDRRVPPEEAAEKGWPALFGPALASAPLVVELGFGRGEFLVDLATRAPDVAHLGVEYSTKRVLKLARRVARLPLENLRLICARAERVVQELLEPASVAAFWVNFPDPWPKKRHLRRRLIQPRLVALLADRLVSGGSLHVATDHEDYADQIDAVLAAQLQLENLYAPDPWRSQVAERLPTAYELEWRAEGRPLHFWHYRRKERS
jgi:tRNA (guanine-N7-)-methyltransferase